MRVAGKQSAWLGALPFEPARLRAKYHVPQGRADAICHRVICKVVVHVPRPEAAPQVAAAWGRAGEETQR